MFIRTKIVATVGPASGELERVRQLVAAGCDVFRINCSHGNEAQWSSFLSNIRQVEAENQQPLAVMADLGGPKIRVGPLPGGQPLELKPGQRVSIVHQLVPGRTDQISVRGEDVLGELEVGQAVLLDDGRLRLGVDEVRSPDEVLCTVIRGGRLASGKGVNFPDTALSVSALTEKDRRDVAWIVRQPIDYVALSFVRRAADVAELRELLGELGEKAERGNVPQIIAKMEKPQAVAAMEEIVAEADGVMVARGDLGVEMELPAVPVAQKRIARLCQTAGKPCIIATQMLESMTTAPTPTRAEVSDVANAVLDCADAVMLSGETAVGDYPAEAVGMMNAIVRQVQEYHDETAQPSRVTATRTRREAAMAGAVREVIADEEIAAVAVFTATGTTARVLAKNRLSRPVVALSPSVEVVRLMALYYGVVPVRADAPEHTRDVLELASQQVLERGFAERGDRIVVLSGRPIGAPGATNTLVVHQV